MAEKVRSAEERDNGFTGKSLIMPCMVIVAFLLFRSAFKMLIFPCIIPPICSMLLMKRYDRSIERYFSLQLLISVFEIAFSYIFETRVLSDSPNVGGLIAIYAAGICPAILNAFIYRKMSGSAKTTQILILADPVFAWAIIHIATMIRTFIL